VPLEQVDEHRWRCPQTGAEYLERDDALTEASNP
jgi:hypothetical protein